MTFVFKDDETFEWPVTLYVPKGGEHQEEEITGLFEMIDDESLLAKPDAIGSASSLIEVEIDRIMTFFKGWTTGSITNADGTPFAANEINIRRFLNRRPNRLAVTHAYNLAVQPNVGARAKN